MLIQTKSIIPILAILAAFVLINNGLVLKYYYKQDGEPWDRIIDDSESSDHDYNKEDRNEKKSSMSFFEPEISPTIEAISSTKENPSTDSIDQMNRTSKQRPWMVVHVGPPKTGTTTIQEGLAQNSPALATFDNIFYVGQNPHAQILFAPYLDQNQNQDSHPMFPMMQMLPVTEQEFIEALKYHQQQNHNVMLSSEHFTSKFPTQVKKERPYFEKIFEQFFLRVGGMADDVVPRLLQPPASEKRKMNGQIAKARATLESGLERDLESDVESYMKSDMESNEDQTRRRLKKQRDRSAIRKNQPPSFGYDIDESFTFGYDVKVVVGYRHYFQWIPSYYYQAELVNFKGGSPSLIEYIETALDKLGDDYFVDNEDVKTMNWSSEMPNGMMRTHGSLYSYILWSLPLSLRNRIDVFDLHQQQIVIDSASQNLHEEERPDLLRDFVCQALPAAPGTCSHLREAEEVVVKRTRTKGGQSSSLVTGNLTSTLIGQLKASAYDYLPDWMAIARNAKNVTLGFDVDLEYSIFKHRGSKKFDNIVKKNFHYWTYHRKDNDGHRQLCLSKESTLKLKNASWNMLRHLEALVRKRDMEGKAGTAELRQEYATLFRAPFIHRSKHPLLLSPNKYDHHVPIEKDGDWWEPIKRAHDELFQQTVEKGAYCELDMERLFADESFVRTIFYRPEDSKESKWRSTWSELKEIKNN